MSREDRAKQFAPFDALKGLSKALRLKEFQHERVLKGDLSEEQVSEISKTLLNIENSDLVEISYFLDGHDYKIIGYCKICFDDRIIEVEDKKIKFENIRSIVIK